MEKYRLLYRSQREDFFIGGEPIEGLDCAHYLRERMLVGRTGWVQRFFDWSNGFQGYDIVRVY